MIQAPHLTKFRQENWFLVLILHVCGDVCYYVKLSGKRSVWIQNQKSIYLTGDSTLSGAINIYLLLSKVKIRAKRVEKRGEK